MTPYQKKKDEILEVFEKSFSKRHGNGHHVLANDGKKSRDCEICQDDAKHNPKGYYLTFLSEKQCYWTREMMEDVKSFLSQAFDEIAREVAEVGMVEKRDHVKSGRNTTHEDDELWCCLDCHDDGRFNAAITQSEKQLETYGVPRE